MSAGFNTTRWSLVRAAKDPGEAGRRALAELCEAWWPPLHAHARRRCASREEAEDAVQEFLARLLERDLLDGVSPERGRLRSFLLACLENHLAHRRERDGAQKRGAGRVLSLQALEGKFGDILEPSSALTPEAAYERAWALTLIERARARLRADMESAGKGRQFELLAPLLAGGEAASHASIAEELSTTVGAVKVAAHRLRHRFGAALRAEVAETVADPSEIEDELRYLLSVLGSEG